MTRGNLLNPAADARTGSRGFFLSLDGPDGGGKTIQAALLADWLRAQGRRVVTCRDPGSTLLGEDRIRPILLDRKTVPLGLRAEMLLYMASRAELVEEIIQPALAEGQVVISDRYVLANLVYQGFAGGLPIEDVATVGKAATGGLLPDLTLVLDVPVEVVRSRVASPRDRMEDRAGDYQLRVREGFLQAARDARAGSCSYYPAPIVVIDAAADLATVTERIQQEVARALA